MKTSIRKLFLLPALIASLGVIPAGRVVAQTGIIITVAGDGTAGYTGDNGAATNAELNSPDGVAVDVSGNLFIADTINNVIRKVGTNGIITTVAGDGTNGYSGDGGAATNAELHNPNGLAVDASGNLFITDEDNNVIRKLDTNGIITTVAGNGTGGFFGDGGAATNAELRYPVDVAVDASGNLFVADSDNYCIRKVATNGVITTVAGNGTNGYSGDGGAATNAEMGEPSCTAVDAFGNLFIGLNGNNVIRKVGTNGIITTVAGNGTNGFSGDGGAATNAELSNPSGLAVDASGNFFIGDRGNNVVRKVGTNGIITTAAGNGTGGHAGDGGAATNAELNTPRHLAVDASENLFIVDYGNNCIRKDSTTASVTAKVIVLSGNLAFGGVAIGSSAQIALTISNAGNATLTISNITFPSGFSGTFSNTIAAGESTSVTVTFAPAGAAVYGTTLTVNSDATSGTGTIPISGYGMNDSLIPTILISGTGKVSPNDNGKTLKAGAKYTFKANAGTGFIFSEWTGSTNCTDNPLVITMESSTVLQANFVSNPFYNTSLASASDLAGTYTGLFYDTNDGFPVKDSGYITVSVTKSGTFSGKLYDADYASRTFALSGQLAEAPDGSFATANLPFIKVNDKEYLKVNLQITTDPNLTDLGAGLLTGFVDSLTNTTETNGAYSAEIQGELSLYNTNIPAGLYNVVMQPASSDPSQGPGGYSYGSVTVSKKGAAKLVLKLADGISPAFSFSTSVAQDGTCPLYASLYGTDGMILGWMQFATNGSGAIFNGSSSLLQPNVNWSKKSWAGGKYYPNGFMVTPILSGHLYLPPKAGANIFEWMDGTFVVDPGYDGLSLPDEIDDSVTFNPVKNTFTDTSKVTITFTKSTGALTGKFYSPTTSTTPFTFHGVDVDGTGYGFYIGPNNETGPIWIGALVP